METDIIDETDVTGVEHVKTKIHIFYVENL